MLLRREFLIGAGAMLSPPLRGAVALLTADAALLAELSPRELRLVLQVIDNCPALTVAKALAMLEAAGM